MGTRTSIQAMAVFMAGALAMTSLAAQGASQKAPGPVPLDPAIDICAKCGMSVKDLGYTAELIADNGKVYKFDDLGCLLAYQKDNPSVVAAARYVQDAGSHVWVALESAFYVVSKDLATPMGYGIHAFAKKADAQEFASVRKDKPKVVGLADLPEPSDSESGSMKM